MEQVQVAAVSSAYPPIKPNTSADEKWDGTMWLSSQNLLKAKRRAIGDVDFLKLYGTGFRFRNVNNAHYKKS